MFDPTMGPEFVAKTVREWLGRIGVKTLYIEPGSPWENGYCESFNSKLRDELLDAEQFSTLHEAQVLIEGWRRHYNTVRPHSSLGYRPPAPETTLPPASGLPYAPLRPAQLLATDGRVLLAHPLRLHRYIREDSCETLHCRSRWCTALAVAN
jgi:hypothetical protein